MDRQDDVSRARRSLQIATIVASGATSLGLVVGYFGMIEAIRVGGAGVPSLGEALVSPLLGALVAGYVFWACYWGIPAVWRHWRRLGQAASDTGCIFFFNPITFFILLALFFYIPLVGGYLYGIFGGGIYEHWKCRRVAGV